MLLAYYLVVVLNFVNSYTHYFITVQLIHRAIETEQIPDRTDVQVVNAVPLHTEFNLADLFFFFFTWVISGCLSQC